jgi:hypothetical protein
LNSQVALLAGQRRAGDERADELVALGKTSLRKLTDDQVGVVIAWAIGAERPGDGSFRHEATEIKGVVTVPAGFWLLHANLGGVRSQNEAINRTLWSVAAERTGLREVDAMAEVYGDDRADPWVNGGLRWNAIEGMLSIDGSYGVQLNSNHARRATVGLKFAF